MKGDRTVDVLAAYRRLLTDGALRMHATDATFELVPSLMERAASDGFAAATEHLVYGDTEWETGELLELVGLTDTEQWSPAAQGWEETVARARERLERDWQTARTRARADHSEAERRARLELIAELLADAEEMVDRLHTPTPSMQGLKPGESLVHPTDEDYAHWSRESKAGRLPPEAWYITTKTLSKDLSAWVSLGGHDLAACEEVTRIHWREPAEHKHALIAAAQREIGISAPAERRRQPERWFGIGAGPFSP
ncbi:MAG TPA: hypothetical protein VFA19_00475 [Gaiellaceae bacterium]|nr:hypothetical protein [Gaiellaceae bacterium]